VVLKWVLPQWLWVTSLSRAILRLARRFRRRQRRQVFGAWFHCARDLVHHRHRACGLGLRVKLGAAALNLSAWAEETRTKRYYRVSCARSVAYRWVAYLRRIWVAWLALAHHAAHSGVTQCCLLSPMPIE